VRIVLELTELWAFVRPSAHTLHLPLGDLYEVRLTGSLLTFCSSLTTARFCACPRNHKSRHESAMRAGAVCQSTRAMSRTRLIVSLAKM
jgi:hypothetical protein